MDLESFLVKTMVLCILGKLTESELFTVVVIETRHLESLMSPKTLSQREMVVNTLLDVLLVL